MTSKSQWLSQPFKEKIFSAKTLFLSSKIPQRICLILVLLLFTATAFSTTALSGQTAFYRINLIVNVCLAALCLIYALLFGRFVAGPYLILVVLFNFITIISFLANGCKTFTTTLLTLSLVSLSLFEFVTQSEVHRDTALLFSLVGIEAFLMYFVVAYFHDFLHPSISFGNRIGILFGNQNDVGRYLAFAFFFNFYFAYSLRLYFCYFFSLISLYAILLTGSVSNLITIFLVIFIFFSFFLKKKAKVIFLIIALALIVGFIVALQFPFLAYYRNRFLGMIASFFGIKTGNSDPSFENRFELAVEGFYLFLENPVFGGGFQFVRANAFQVDFAHNNYAEVAASFGIFGLLAEETLILWPIFAQKSNKKTAFFQFIMLVTLYIFLFQLFLVSYYSKMEFFCFPFIYACLSRPFYFEFSFRGRGFIYKKTIVN
jgi:O-antigen ligase